MTYSYYDDRIGCKYMSYLSPKGRRFNCEIMVQCITKITERVGNILEILQIEHCKNKRFEKTCCSVNWENHIFHNILIFKTCYLHLDTGSNIYLGELLVGHRASISSLSFSIICAAVTFKHVKKVFPCRCFWLTLFWKHFFNMLKRLDCRKVFDIHNYVTIYAILVNV